MIRSRSARRLLAEPLTALEFAPFGDVLDNDGSLRRNFYPDATKQGDGLGELRFWVSHVEPTTTKLISITQLERHPFAAQSFIPLSVSRWLIIVAPRMLDESPDIGRLRAFIAAPGVGICYRRGTWHRGTTVLNAAAQFGVLMWRRAARDDDEFYDLKEPIEIDIAGDQVRD